MAGGRRDRARARLVARGPISGRYRADPRLRLRAPDPRLARRSLPGTGHGTVIGPVTIRRPRIHYAARTPVRLHAPRDAKQTATTVGSRNKPCSFRGGGYGGNAPNGLGWREPPACRSLISGALR